MTFVSSRRLNYSLQLVLIGLLVFVAVSPAWSQANTATTDSGADLRSTIEQAEAVSGFRAMILAAVELRDTAESAEDRIFAQRSIGRAYALLGDFERAVEALSEAVTLAEPGISPRLLAEIYRDTAGMLGEIGRPEQALSIIERGMASLSLPDDRELETEFLIMRSSVLALLGELDEALSSIQKAMDGPLSIPRQQIKRRNNLGMIYKMRGELSSALVEFRAVYERAQALDSEQLIVYGLLELGDVERQLGDLRAAREHLDEALERADAAGEVRWALFAHMYLADLAAAEGNGEAENQHRDTVAGIQAEMQGDNATNRAQVLEISLEVLEREQQVERLQMEAALQEMRLARSRTIMLLGTVAAMLLIVALGLAVQKSRMRATANRELDRLAHTDVLTGLHNRRFFLEQLRSRVSEGKAEGSLIMIDFDHFKRVNDQYGHDHGDAVLNAGADRIQSMMRAQDVLARWGGEEFLVYLPNCGDSAARQVAERILTAIREPRIVHDGIQHQITATAGIARLDSGQNLDVAVRNADEALRRGKEDGRNQVRFSEQTAPTGV